MNFRKRLFEIISTPRQGDWVSHVSDWGIVAFILLSVLSVILSSFADLPKQVSNILTSFDTISVVVFTCEYLARVVTASLAYPTSKAPFFRFTFSFMGIVDLLAILPFFIPLLIPFDLRFLRVMRIFRLLGIFKLNRYSDAMRRIGNVLKRERQKLVSTLFVCSILILMSASLMYYAENEAQPDKFPNIVAAFWWAVATLTTVGYGDVYPITLAGKILAGIISILGIGLVALPAGILSSGFVAEMADEKKEITCPHCGKKLD